MPNEATCSTCPWFTDTTGRRQADAEGARAAGFSRPDAYPGGECNRMPAAVFKRADGYCGEHPERQTLETKVRRLQMEPGDLAVLESARPLTVEEREKITHRWKEAFSGTRAVVRDRGLHLASVLGERRPPAMRVTWRRAARPGPEAWEGISGEHAAAILDGTIDLEGAPLRPDERAELEETCRRFGIDPYPATGGPVEPGTYVVGEQPLEDGHLARLPPAGPGEIVVVPADAVVSTRAHHLGDLLQRGNVASGVVVVHGAKPGAIRED